MLGDKVWKTRMKKMKIVAAAILKRNGKLFIAKRPEGKSLAHHWEFPGGKQEEGETLQETLHRELREELNIETEVGEFFMQSTYDYDFGQIQINCFWVKLCDENCTIYSNEHEETAWVLPSELKNYRFAPADVPVVEALSKVNDLTVLS